MRKGQMFSLDAFLSILGITIILGLVTTQFTLLFDQYDNNIFERLETIAADMNNIAVSKILLPAGGTKPAIIDPANINQYEDFLKDTLGEEYRAEVHAKDLSINLEINGGCKGATVVASNRRVVIHTNSKKVSWFETVICYAE